MSRDSWWVEYLAHVHSHRARRRREEAAICVALGVSLVALACVAGWALW